MKRAIAGIVLTFLCVVGLALLPLGGVLIARRSEIKRTLDEWLMDPEWRWPPASAN